MIELSMRKVLAGEVGRGSFVLVPVDHIGAEEFAKAPRGEDLHVQLSHSVNERKWRLFQALVAKVAEAHPDFHDRDDAIEDICMAVRHVRKARNPKTKNVIVSRRSTSPSAFTSGAEFDRFFERAFYYVRTELLPGVPESVLRKEIEEMVTPNIGGGR